MPPFLKCAAVLVLLAAPAAAQEFRVRPVKHDTSSVAAHAVPSAAVKPAAPSPARAAKATPKLAASQPAVTVRKTADAARGPSGPAAEPTEHVLTDVRQMGAPLPTTSAPVKASAPDHAAPTPAPAAAAPAVITSTPVAAAPVAQIAAHPAADSTTSHAAPKVASHDSVATTPVAKPVPAAATTKAVAPLTLNLGTLLFTGNLQAFYVAGSSDVINTFKIRRAELKFVGTLSPTVKWTMMVDPAKALKVTNGVANQSTTILQDAFITLKAKSFDITAGQFLIPLTFEGSGFSASVLETYDRSLMVTDGKFGQVRDLGAMLGGPIALGAKFRVGLFNGVGDSQNTSDGNGQKAIIARIESPTPVSGLRLGMSGAYGGDSTSDNPRHDRIGGDAEFAWDKLGLRGEIMKGWDGTDVKLGWYGLASYMLRDDVMLVSRYDAWDKDATATPKGVLSRERDLLVGTSWLLQGTNVQVRANYVFRYLNTAPQRDQVIVSLQAAW